MRYRKSHIFVLLFLLCLSIVWGQQSSVPFSAYTSTSINSNQEMVTNMDMVRGELKIYAEEGSLAIETSVAGETATIYNAVGRVLKQVVLRKGVNRILISGGRQLLIVKVGNSAYKLQIK